MQDDEGEASSFLQQRNIPTLLPEKLSFCRMEREAAANYPLSGHRELSRGSCRLWASVREN